MFNVLDTTSALIVYDSLSTTECMPAPRQRHSHRSEEKRTAICISKGHSSGAEEFEAAYVVVDNEFHGNHFILGSLP
jgi:hypothetical protein